MAARLRLSLEVWRDGVVTYRLDKTPDSRILPLARDLSHEFRD